MTDKKRDINLDFTQAVKNMGEQQFDEFLDMYVNLVLNKEEKIELYQKIGVEKMAAIVNKIGGLT